MNQYKNAKFRFAEGFNSKVSRNPRKSIEMIIPSEMLRVSAKSRIH